MAILVHRVFGAELGESRKASRDKHRQVSKNVESWFIGYWQLDWASTYESRQVEASPGTWAGSAIMLDKPAYIGC